MADQQNERLARLETKLEFLKELLTEIRKDVKSNPTIYEYKKVEQRLNRIEKWLFPVMLLSGVIGYLFKFIA